MQERDGKVTAAGRHATARSEMADGLFAKSGNIGGLDGASPGRSGLPPRTAASSMRGNRVPADAERGAVFRPPCAAAVSVIRHQPIFRPDYLGPCNGMGSQQMDAKIGPKNLNVTAVELPNRGEGGQGVKKKEQALSSMSAKQLRDVIRPKYEDTVAGFGKLGFCSALRIKLKAVKEMVSNLSLKAYSDTNASKKMEFMQSRLAFMKEFEAVADLAISGKVGGRFSDPETLANLAGKDPLSMTAQLLELVKKATVEFGDSKEKVFSPAEFMRGVNEMRVLLMGEGKPEVNTTMLRELKDQFDKQSRFDKDRLVLAQATDLLLSQLSRPVDRQVVVDRYVMQAKTGILNQAKTTFLRENSDATSAIKGLLRLVEGGPQLIEGISSMTRELLSTSALTDLKQSLDVQKQDDKITRAAIKSFTNAGEATISADQMDGFLNLTRTFFERMNGLPVSQEVRRSLGTLADSIWTRVGATENGITLEEAKSQVRALYTSSVILREANPSLIDQAASGGKVTVGKMLAAVIQTAANGLTNFSEEGTQVAKTKYFAMAPDLIRVLENMLVDKFGMPPEVRLTQRETNDGPQVN